MALIQTRRGFLGGIAAAGAAGLIRPKPSSDHADKLAARVVTRSFPW